MSTTMMRSAFVLALFVLLGGCAVDSAAPAGAPSLRVAKLSCEYAENPLGIDAARPRLTWVLESDRRGEKQTAYRVLVASSAEKLKANEGDLWDSGKVKSPRSVHVVYEGAGLSSGQRVHWKVQVWDRDGSPRPWSAPAWWEMGLLKKDDWKAKWVAFPSSKAEAPKVRPNLADATWIWTTEVEPQKDAPKGIRYFRKHLNIPAAKSVKTAEFLAYADDYFVLWVNGRRAGHGEGKGQARVFEIGTLLQPGDNLFAMEGNNHGGPAALIGRMVILFESGEQMNLSTDESWVWLRPFEDKPWHEKNRDWMAPSRADKEWKPVGAVGKWGEGPWKNVGQKKAFDEPQMGPAPFLRGTFTLAKKVRSARLYGTALGLYEASLNGKKVGEDYFTPEWTDYRDRVQYQTYDVTGQLKQGGNTLGVIVGDGWYAGYLGWANQRAHYGALTKACVQLNVTYEDGTKETFGTDGSWKGSEGPILYGDLYQGEYYDARREMPGWNRNGFDDSSWRPVQVEKTPEIPVVAQPSPRIKAMKTLKAVKMTEPKPGHFVFDLAQNMVGIVRLKVEGPAGTKITLRYVEMLNPDGTIYTTNLRSARCTDTYVLRGGGEEVWEPRHTFHGFRYVELTGYPGRPNLDAVEGIVTYNAMKLTGKFECSSRMVNQLQHNIQWGQRGNFLTVPTDCPQRDERLGWMGDAQIFCRAACFNMDVSGFMTKWVQDIRDAQTEEGRYNDVSPSVIVDNSGAPAWGDAGTIVPWTVYLAYADRRMLEQHYESAKKWIRWVHGDNPNFIWVKRVGNNYGDWVAVGSDTPREVLSTAFFANSARLVSKMAKVLGKVEEAAKYEELFQRIRAAFNSAFVRNDGTIHGKTQTCYVLALRFDLLDEEKRKLAIGHLAEDVEKHDWHLTTGFLGTGHLLHALAENGRADAAYKLLLQESYPSWGYSISQGATTIWERWDGWTRHGGFQTPEMNSFNHYAFGAVGEFMYQKVAGINLDPAKPAYEHVIIRPLLGAGLTRARAEYDSIRGKIVSGWEVEGDRLHLKVTIPANTVATIHVPINGGAKVSEKGGGAGLSLVNRGDAYEVYSAGSGTYDFSVSGFEAPR